MEHKPLSPSTMHEPHFPVQATWRLLIIDDDPRLSRSLKELLLMESYDVGTCGNGFEALDILRDEHFDLILLDLEMPGMDGHQTLEKLAVSHPNLPVIVVSGDSNINSAIDALRKGVYDYIRKPYRPEELLKTIENALDKRRLEWINHNISAKLNYSEGLYHYLIDSSPDIIYTLDKDGNFTYINKRVTELLGFESEELLGRHYSTLIHEEDQARAKYAFNERRKGSRATQNYELRLKHKNLEDGYSFFETQFVTIELNAFGLYLGGKDNHSALNGTYGVARDISERKIAEEAIRHQAYHDMLTGLPNRALFQDRLSVAMTHAQRNKSMLGIIFLDLDRFKWVNDTLGHLYGDELLKVVAIRLKTCLRKGDTLARMGGDEFTILLPEIADKKDTSMIADKIQNELERPFVLDGHEIFISCSIGISIYPDHGSNIEDLIKSADIAMYHVKGHGKNGFQHYEASMNAVLRHKMTLESDLRRAFENSQLMLYFQPQVNLKTCRVVGLEVLTRWFHPERGWIPPNDFIPLAEETGMIGPLTDWMLNGACAQLRKWRDAGIDDLGIAVNISSRTLESRDFVTKILNPLRKYGIPTSLLEVEITESLLVQDVETAIMKLGELSSHGIEVAIDDFGIGYSSLYYLQKLPVNCIKIDKSFVHEIRSDQDDLPILAAIAGIAQGFNMRLVAEGIENSNQMQVIQSYGCQVVQGFLFSKPLPPDQVLPLLLDQSGLFQVH